MNLVKEEEVLKWEYRIHQDFEKDDRHEQEDGTDHTKHLKLVNKVENTGTKAIFIFSRNIYVTCVQEAEIDKLFVISCFVVSGISS